MTETKTLAAPAAPTKTRHVRIRQVKKSEWDLMLQLASDLFAELESPPCETPQLQTTKLKHELARNRVKHFAFFAIDENEEVVGLATAEECFGIFANGFFGSVHEIYVRPEFRNLGIGKKLTDHLKTFGMLKNWTMIQTSVPFQEKWAGIRRFYEKSGFGVDGAKMKFEF